MWGALLLAVIVSASTLACYGCGCCGVAWTMTRFGARTARVLLATYVGGSALLIAALAAYEFAYRGGALAAVALAALALAAGAAWVRLWKVARGTLRRAEKEE